MIVLFFSQQSLTSNKYLSLNFTLFQKIKPFLYLYNKHFRYTVSFQYLFLISSSRKLLNQNIYFYTILKRKRDIAIQLISHKKHQSNKSQTRVFKIKFKINFTTDKNSFQQKVGGKGVHTRWRANTGNYAPAENSEEQYSVT